MRNLRVVMDSHLDMQAHVSNLREVCYYYIVRIKDMRHVLSEVNAKVLVHSLIISRLEYCNVLICGLPDYLIYDY